MSFGRGSATLAYRPIGVRRVASTPTELTIGMNFGGDPALAVEPDAVEPLAVDPAGLRRRRRRTAWPAVIDGLPEVELFDLDAQTWRPPAAPRRRRPRYAVADPARYVDPTIGHASSIRFVNDRDRPASGSRSTWPITGTIE